jgi:hypothetical protein
LQDLSTKDLVCLGNLLSIEFMKPNRQLYAILGRWAWVPWKNIPKIDEETKIPFFAVFFGSLDVLIWIRIQIGKGVFASLKIQEFLNNS